MRVLILGDGPTDLGRTEADGTLQLEGALPILVRKLFEQAASDTVLEFRAQELKRIRLFSSGPRRIGQSQHGYAAKLRALLGLQEGREADAVVAVVDRDEEKFADRIVELNKGREELQTGKKPCAVGMAIEEIEAWLLADEKALRSALDDPSLQRQPNPEELSSRDEKSDRNAKGRLERIIQKALGDGADAPDFPEQYALIAAEIELSVLEERCPLGFQPFAEQVRELIPKDKVAANSNPS